MSVNGSRLPYFYDADRNALGGSHAIGVGRGLEVLFAARRGGLNVPIANDCRQASYSLG